MDTVTGFLAGPRAREAFMLRVLFSPPFGVWVEDDVMLTVVAVTAGQAWIVPEHGEPFELGAGDLMVVTGGQHYLVADHPDTRPTFAVNGPTSRSLDGSGIENPCEALNLGVRTWGNDPAGETVLMFGNYAGAGEVGRGLVEALPGMAVLRADEWQSPALDLLATELQRESPGQQVLLDRLLDVVTIGAVRELLSRPDVDAPGWFAAAADPLVGHALRLLESRIDHPWTVTELAAAVGLSRAALARRFTDLLGEPPISYLTRRRLALAADLLDDPQTTVNSVSRKVGYASPFTFSAAFKREYGVSPSARRVGSRTA